MRYGILGLVVAAGWYTLASPAPHHAARAKQGDRWSWHGRIAAGQTLEIRGINGDVTAEPAPGDEAEVTAVKRGRRSDPDEVRIEVVQTNGNVTICAVYPGDTNRCAAGGGRMNTHNNDVQVRFTVKVPRGVAYEGHTVNGDVEATGLTGAAELTTVNGSVHLETSSGDASGSTVNGSVVATVRALGERAMRFRTVNGGITLSVPDGLNADFEARTVNGSIDTDFPISVTGRMSPRHLAGTIGRGGRRLDVETVNGSIRLRKVT